MDSSFLRGALYGIGREALVWAPLAVGLATNNPTILTVSEVGYAAFYLHSAYKSESRTGRLAALSNAAISLISPFTYHPALTSQISASIRAHILIGMGGNNVIRGVSEIASVTKNLACVAFAKICGEEETNENGGIVGMVAGNTLRLGLGIFRVYSGVNQIDSGLSELSIQPLEPDVKNSQESPKMDPKYARDQFKRNSKSKAPPSERSAKMDPKYAKEEFHRSPNPKAQPNDKCFPKSGKHHPYDVAFYGRVSDPMKTPSINTEGRCEGTLYLRSEDTNYLHAKDNYLRAEDSRPVGEIKPKVIDALIKDGRVWYRTIETNRDICKEIDKVHELGGKVKRLILVGHGNKDEMLFSQKVGKNEKDLEDVLFRFGLNPQSPFSSPFGSSSQKFPIQRTSRFDQYDFFKESNLFDNFFDKQQSFTKKNLDNYILDKNVVFPKKGCLNYLEPEADIILIGCSTGQKTPEGNLADAIARQAPGHKVFAPLTTTTMNEFVVRAKNGKPGFYFETSVGIDYTHIAQVKKTKK